MRLFCTCQLQDRFRPLIRLRHIVVLTWINWTVFAYAHAAHRPFGQTVVRWVDAELFLACSRRAHCLEIAELVIFVNHHWFYVFIWCDSFIDNDSADIILIDGKWFQPFWHSRLIHRAVSGKTGLFDIDSDNSNMAILTKGYGLSWVCPD